MQMDREHRPDQPANSSAYPHRQGANGSESQKVHPALKARNSKAQGGGREAATALGWNL
jgi:hypothetical protein